MANQSHRFAMLGFFRKYQKFFFLIVTFFIVVSFVFFGTSNTMDFRDETPNKEIGKLVDGSSLMEKDLHGLLRLVEHGIEEGGRNFNLLNNSLVHREIVLSGLAEILADHYFDEMEGELAERWRRVKGYIPYQHPYAPFISSRNVWAQYAPEINALLDEVKAAPETFTKEQLPLLFKLYQAQAQFPSYYLHQVLYYQQQGQGEQVRPDPSLQGLNVSLFGYESIEDWFGSKFIERLGVFLMNASCIAREEGYKISKEEAHVDLLTNVYQGLKMMGREQDLNDDSVQAVITSQVRSLGLNLEEAIAHWRGVMRFKRHFQEVGDAVFLDRLAFDQFKQFAKASDKICRYKMPSHFELHDFRDLMKFQHYLEVAAEGDFLGLPATFRSPEKVLEEHPELVYKPFVVEMASVSAHDVAARISLKKTWEWEEENFAALQEEFSFLVDKPCETVEQRYASLESLGEVERLRVDQFARKAMVEQNPSLIDEALALAPFEKQTLKVTKVDGEFSGPAFLELLESGGVSKYTHDDQIYTSIRVLEKGEDWELFTYSEASTSGALDGMLDRLLLVAYENMEFDAPFEEAIEEVGEAVFTDLLEEIKKCATAPIEDRDDYAHHRFDGYLEKMRAQARQDIDSLNIGPWALEKVEEYLAMESDVEEGGFSTVADGSFFQLLEREELGASEEEVAAAKEHLKRDAQQALMRKILSRL